jgi:hypothetical protein
MNIVIAAIPTNDEVTVMRLITHVPSKMVCLTTQLKQWSSWFTPGLDK